MSDNVEADPQAGGAPSAGVQKKKQQRRSQLLHAHRPSTLPAAADMFDMESVMNALTETQQRRTSRVLRQPVRLSVGQATAKKGSNAHAAKVNIALQDADIPAAHMAACELAEHYSDLAQQYSIEAARFAERCNQLQMQLNQAMHDGGKPKKSPAKKRAAKK